MKQMQLIWCNWLGATDFGATDWMQVGATDLVQPMQRDGGSSALTARALGKAEA
jgi:hypothetical protein